MTTKPAASDLCDRAIPFGRVRRTAALGGVCLAIVFGVGCLGVGVTRPNTERVAALVDAGRPAPQAFVRSGLSVLRRRCGDVAEDVLRAFLEGGDRPPRDTGMVCHEESLDERQARMLAGNRFSVFLPKVRVLRPDAARHLGTCTGILDFASLDVIDAETAMALAGTREALRFHALTQIDAAIARGLAASCCTLKLDGLSRLEAGVAVELARHRGVLALNGLAALSAEDARHLAEHEGDLCLNGLRHLSTDAARALARSRHALHLNGIETLSTEAAIALADHVGWCLGCAGLLRLDAEGISALSRHGRSGRALGASLAALDQ